MNSRKPIDLIVASVFSLFTLLVAFLGLRSTTVPGTLPVWFLPIGFAMVLLLPGYFLVKATLPSLDGITVLLLSLSLSITLNVIGILVLNLLPGGLSPVSWAVWVSGLTLLGCLIVAIRRRYRPDLYHNSFFFPRLQWRKTLPFLIAAVIMLASVLLARYSTLQSGTTFTQLWALPASTGLPYELEIGIRNYERQDQKYNLYVESRGVYLYSKTDIAVAAGESWTVVLSLDEKPIKPVQVYLYLSSAPEAIYRRVQIAPVAFDGPLAPTRTIP